ncbi:MAG: AOC03_06830 family ribosome hibernation factor [Anaerolineae bacterium]
MNRLDVQLLQSVRGYPAVSILLPTHRHSPANQQDPIRVKNLVRQAADRLLAELPKREVEPLLMRLQALTDKIDYLHALDGLALFAHRDWARAFYLPFAVRERVVIDETFATRDLVFALNRSPRYWVLALSEKPTRLYEGLRDSLVEVTTGGFPMTHEGPGGELKLPGGVAVHKSAYRDERHRQFFRQVDEAFGRLAASDPLPLAVVGVDRFLAFYDQVTKHKNLIATTVTGSHDKTPAHELAALVWPLVQANLALRRNTVLQELEAAVSARQYASGIGEVWRLAQEGRAAALVVEENYRCPARIDPTGQHLMPADDPEAPNLIDDAVDEIIETVLAKGGRVVFVDDGALAIHQRIALMLRY